MTVVGGLVDSTTVNSGGRLSISGGIALNIKENGGYIDIHNSAATFTSNSFSSLTLVRNSATVHSGTTAIET